MGPAVDYGRSVPEISGGGVIASVEPGSPADRAGISPGDVIAAVDGEALRDVIDWRWLADAERAELTVVRSGAIPQPVSLRREPGQTWGIEFTEAVFDGVRTCRNRCTFCFMTQLPRGLRRALYLRDDDYRLSFLQGNFVTLTNLSDVDVERIVEQGLSPLYVSLHSVDPRVRERLVCAREDRALDRLDALLEAGIDVHIQIVLVPGINDGEDLERTLTWLAEREGVASVGIVPLGFTAHQRRFERSYDSGESAAIVARIGEWQAASRSRDGITWVHLADEFYLRSGIPVPEAQDYDGFPQYENGIGLVRTWVDELDALAVGIDRAARLAPRPVVLVTGSLFATTLATSVASITADAPARISVLPVENRFFGGNVGVTGLLAAADLVPAIAHVPPGSAVLVPDVIANSDGLLLDDVPAAELAARTGRDVRLVSCDAAGLLEGLEGLSTQPLQERK